MIDLNLTEKSKLMPSVFVGHGSPMNLIEKNEFANSLKQMGEIFQPQAILVISAHWQDKASIVQNAENQKLIYDFHNFPEELYTIKYPSQGWGHDLASKITDLGIENINFTDARGLDHGTWAVLLHMYPKANIPVVQMSIPYGLQMQEYFQIGRKLSQLRQHGIMIISSGNIVHNLYQINWDMKAPVKKWAMDFDKKIEHYINIKDFDKILSLPTDEPDLFRLAHPTNEHFIPLAYALGASLTSDEMVFPCSFIQNSSISMRSVLFF